MYTKTPCLQVTKIGSRRTQDSVHELIVVDLNPTVTVGIQPLEGLGNSLDNNTCPNKSVKCDTRRGSMVTWCGYAGSFDIYPEIG